MTERDVSVLEQQLRAHPLVRGLEEADIAKVLNYARLVEFEAHDSIFEEGGSADTFYLVRTGVVGLLVSQAAGQQRRIESIHEGSALGWSWLFPPYVWQFSATAETLVRGIAIDAVGLRDEFDEDPGFGYRLIARIAEVMAKRLHAARRHLINLMGT